MAIKSYNRCARLIGRKGNLEDLLAETILRDRRSGTDRLPSLLGDGDK
jgi:hypothetical protein